MREKVEFRIGEKYARQFLEPDQGKRLGSSVRALVVDTRDPLYERIGAIYRSLRQQDEYFYHGWITRRQYSRAELEAAELFRLEITSVFEPAGEAVGTVYDDGPACRLCGAGRRQVSELVLDLRKAPKSAGIARTIADEWIVSQRVAELLLSAGMTGFHLRPARHKARFRDDPIDFSRYETGRRILAMAEAAGFPQPTGAFWIWYNRPEQSPLREELASEHEQQSEARARRARGRPVPIWYQLEVASRPVTVLEPTRFGIKPFDESDEYRCPLGHVSGLNLLSELWIKRDTWDGSDLVRTEQMVGMREGLLVPAPLLLISPRLWRLLERDRVRGYKVEVAHLV